MFLPYLSPESTTLPTLFLSSTEHVVQNVSTILYIILYSTDGARCRIFFTEISATFFPYKICTNMANQHWGLMFQDSVVVSSSKVKMSWRNGHSSWMFLVELNTLHKHTKTICTLLLIKDNLSAGSLAQTAAMTTQQSCQSARVQAVIILCTDQGHNISTSLHNNNTKFVRPEACTADKFRLYPYVTLHTKFYQFSTHWEFCIVIKQCDDNLTL
jgi:hypothetical protein